MARYFNTCDGSYSLSYNEERNFDIAWKNVISNRKRRSVIDDDENKVYKVDVPVGNDTMERKSLEPGVTSYNNLTERQKYLKNKFETTPYRTKIRKAELDLKSEGQPRNFPNTSYESETVLKRSRRALKFKIKRKTLHTSSVLKHSDEVSIDEQYLLPNGLVRPDKKHWLYNDMSTLRGFPYYGYFATYSGGGYVASLSTDIDFARATAMALEQDSWADMLTRALLFEFSVYNANMNFFATGFVIIEIHPTGSVVPNANIRVFKLYRYVGTFGKVVMASEIILVLCLFFFIYKECRHMYRLGCGYFKLFWSWIEITIAVALFTALILRAFSWYEGDKNLIALRQNMEQFINFHYTVVADDALLLSITIICFASTLKIIKLLIIFPTFVYLKETIQQFASPLLNYSFPFSIAFMGFASLGYLLFHTELMFSSYINSCQTQLLMLTGGSVYHALRHAHSTLGPLFFLLFAAFETFILMNIFLAIINDGIKESMHWKAGEEGSEFIKFIEDRVRAIFNLKPVSNRAEKEVDVSTNQSTTPCSKNSTIKQPDTSECTIDEKVPNCEPVVKNSSRRKVTFSDRVIHQTSIRKSSILETLSRKLKREPLKYTRIVSEEATPKNATVIKVSSDGSEKSGDVAKMSRKNEIQLLINDLRDKRQAKNMFERWKLRIERLEDFMQGSIEDDVNDLKIDLMIYLKIC